MLHFHPGMKLISVNGAKISFQLHGKTQPATTAQTEFEIGGKSKFPSFLCSQLASLAVNYDFKPRAENFSGLHEDSAHFNKAAWKC